MPVSQLSAPKAVVADRRSREQGLPEGTVLLLARVACGGGATQAELVRDLAPLAAHLFPLAVWREKVAADLGALLETQVLAEKKGRITLTKAGMLAARAVLGDDSVSGLAWTYQRDVRLVATALGVPSDDTAGIAALAKPDALRARILQTAFGLPPKAGVSPSRLRSLLAVVALERAFGNKIKSGLGQGGGLSAKAARLLAGQLSKKPRDFGTDGRLIAVLAAEQVGATHMDEHGLRLAVLREFASRLLGRESVAGETGDGGASLQARKEAAPQNTPSEVVSLPLSSRPDLAGFVATVRKAAQRRGEGWSGNRKAFIFHVWEEIRAAAPHWNLTEIEFKCMLTEAHRTGALMLAHADLKNKQNVEDLRRSEIGYKNTVWHYVRVEDDD